MTRILPILAVLALLILPACTSLQDLIALRDRASDQRAALTNQAQEIEAALARIPPTHPDRPALEDRLREARILAAAYDADAHRLDQVIAEARSPSDPIAQAVGAIAPFLPIPARTPLVLGAALLGTLLRMHQLRAGLTSVARGFEIAKRDDPDFKARFEANSPTFASVQTPLARRIISHAIKGAA